MEGEIHGLLSGFSLWCVYLNEVIYGIRMKKIRNKT